MKIKSTEIEKEKRKKKQMTHKMCVIINAIQYLNLHSENESVNFKHHINISTTIN